jgi:hypothetical protein
MLGKRNKEQKKGKMNKCTRRQRTEERKGKFEIQRKGKKIETIRKI